jgi:hypothetical protein
MKSGVDVHTAAENLKSFLENLRIEIHIFLKLRVINKFLYFHTFLSDLGEVTE